MKTYCSITFFIICLILCTISKKSYHSQRNDQPFNPNPENNLITIYYEPLCIDSVLFFSHNFNKFYKKRHDFLESKLIDKIILLPGALMKYDTSNSLTNIKGMDDLPIYNFSCIHGRNECLGNKFHACTYNLLSLEQHNKYVLCYMKNIRNRHFRYNNYKLTNHCARVIDFDYYKIENCVRTEGDKFLFNILKRRDNLTEKVKHAPWLLVNNESGRYIQDNHEDDMIKLMCKLFSYNPALKFCQDYINTEF